MRPPKNCPDPSNSPSIYGAPRFISLFSVYLQLVAAMSCITRSFQKSPRALTNCFPTDPQRPRMEHSRGHSLIHWQICFLRVPLTPYTHTHTHTPGTVNLAALIDHLPVPLTSRQQQSPTFYSFNAVHVVSESM